MYKAKIFKVLKNTHVLPTMLTVAMEINRMTADPDTTIEQIEALIKNDMTLTAKVLKIANSPTFAGTRRIVSLNSAISRLGLAEISKLSLTVSFLNMFKPNFIDYEKFWIHSISVAYIASKINDMTTVGVKTDKLFTSAILHDLGIMILDQYFGSIYKKVFDIALTKNIDLTLVEQNVLGTTHAEVGA
ncbi:MAG: HDOD domain-containing protein, partial [Candidatus Cloacimonetes bacterium]|nr:HDOD domain-containing protein [Candidatus Cloacimonadota bacterium]